MCGIAGIFRLSGRPDVEDAAAVLRMLDAQVHRGPDDWGLLVPEEIARAAAGLVECPEHLSAYVGPPGPGAILGSRRLSILDRSPAGRMPMAADGGRLFITHSGEVYNYRELRAELGRVGAPFRSGTDTETVLRGYAAWGDEVVPRLRGMFAFALFEASPRPRLLLARDRFGIKPLYYFRDRVRLIFASEVRALVASGLVPDQADPAARIRFLQWGSVPAPLTTVRGVATLPAGHSLRAEAPDRAPRRYVPPPALDGFAGAGGLPRPGRAGVDGVPAHAAPPFHAVASAGGATRGASDAGSEAAERTRALLDEAVRLHLASDVPLGVFLSGGIDSSALVALARRWHEGPLTTLSVAPGDREHDESAYARLVAGRYRTDHREVALGSADFFAALPRFFRAMDQPTVDGVNTYLIADAARQAGLGVVLSGTGGDEVFLGYGHHRRGPALDRLSRLLAACPPGPRRALLRGAATAGAAIGRSGLARLEYLASPGPGAAYLAVRGLFGPAEVCELLGMDEAELARYGPPLADAADAPSGATAAVEALEFTHYLQDQLLRDTDVMSMAHSVEVRVPYLDHPLVDYVRGLPAAVRLGGPGPKPLLIRALGDALPRQVWDRPKMGFTLPFAAWLGERADELRAVSAERSGLERRAVEAVWDRFRAGRAHWSRPWALAVLGRFDGPGCDGRTPRPQGRRAGAA